MGRRDRGHERFLAEPRWARERTNRARARARARAGSPTAIAPYTANKSYRAIRGSRLWFRCERSELILGENRPGAFAFLPHDGGPVLGCRIEGVGIHELAVRVIEGEIDGVGSFV